ncbi:MAG: hypothetical protein JSW07_08390 [bacterium]|nr:MAG: hypothetical protein JSW07_08390 [bacterium]
MYDHKEFFINPKHLFQRQYEALRAFYVEKKAAKQVAFQFGFSVTYFNKLRSYFHQTLEQGQMPNIFATPNPGRNPKSVETNVKQQVISLRKENHSIVDIKAILDAKNIYLSQNQIDKILKADGFARLHRRSKSEKSNIELPAKIKPPKCRQLTELDFLHTQKFDTRYGGVFLFLPLMEQLNLARLIERSDYPSTEQLSNLNYILSFIFLKLIDKKRLSHVEQLSLDRGAGLFAGLNVLPRSSSLSSYSYKTTRSMNRLLLKSLFNSIHETHSFSGDVNLDFTAIPHWGDVSVLERNWSGTRHTRLKSILALVCQDPESGFLIYSDAEVKNRTKDQEVLTFVDFWQECSHQPLKCLIFDSKFTTYQNLSLLNRDGIKFITLRRRGSALIRQAQQLPESQWTTIKIDKPKRKYSSPKVNESKISLNGYDGVVRQLIVTNTGREKPSFIITNDFEMSSKNVLLKYARRWLVEKSIAEQIDFFHLNLVGSSIVVKVDFDLTMTLIAYSLYKMLAKKIIGFERSTAQNLFLDFVDNGAEVKIIDNKIIVLLRKRVHNSILFETNIFKSPVKIPWLGNLEVVFDSQNTS